MRKIILVLFAVILTAGLAITGFAEQADLVISDAEAAPGEVIYLTVSLQKQLSGDAMGLSYSYDEKILEPLPAASWSWIPKSAIKNFDIKNNRAVWGAEKSTQLYGEICVMAFRVLDNAKLKQTKVTCQLIVKNQGTEVGTYAAEGLVGQPCEHEYGPWDGADILCHTATCAKCGLKITQTHAWDDGAQTTVNGKNMMRFTCSVCHKSRDVELTGTGDKETKPLGPSDTPATMPDNEPTIPDEWPENDHQHNENVWDTLPVSPDEHEGHDHNNADNDSQTTPNDDDDVHGSVEEDDHGHVHEEPIAGQSDPVTGIVIGVAIALMLVAAVYFVKKR